ncbi:MAG: sensor histidine kinase [Adlercreutzia equolifaciens]
MLRNALPRPRPPTWRKTRSSSNMSHDIRTPLNAVVGYASLISAHGGEAERVRAYSDKVLAASEQLLDVVNETLEISRMEAGHVQLAEAGMLAFRAGSAGAHGHGGSGGPRRRHPGLRH